MHTQNGIISKTSVNSKGEEKEQRTNGTNKSNKQNSKCNSTLSVGTLNENDLKTSIKRNCQSGEKGKPNYLWSKRNHFIYKDINTL